MNAVNKTSVITYKYLVPRQSLGIEEKRRKSDGKNNSTTEIPSDTLLAIAMSNYDE